MAQRLNAHEARQEMQGMGFEIQHKRDTYLKTVELHHHDFYEIFYLVSGDVTYVIEGRLCRLYPGDLLLVSPRELHQVSIQSDMEAYERYVLWIDQTTVRRLSEGGADLEEGLNPLRPGYANLHRLSREQQKMVRNLMETLFQESSSESFGAELLRKNLVTALLVQINRLTLQMPEGAEETAVSNPMVAELIDYIHCHYRDRLTLDSLAEHFYVSKYHLSHEFRRCMGIGVYRYLQKKRLQIARQLLAGGEHPSEVSSLCGFSDYAGFYRAFVNEYGAAPREYAESVR